eukprot:1371948-Amorphochlora_amoeboformis.AAC.1
MDSRNPSPWTHGTQAHGFTEPKILSMYHSELRRRKHLLGRNPLTDYYYGRTYILVHVHVVISWVE